MTAAVVKGPQSATDSQGLRPIEPRRDMAAIARLIEVSFAGELDPSSRRMVREMRAFGQAGWLGWLLGRLFLPPAAYPKGFVWQLQDRVVGNASLLPVSRQSNRWVLANVAVHPEHRRHGIARKLVLACIDLAKQEHAAEIVLQVRHDNQGAQDLYQRLDFKELTTRTTWKLEAGLGADKQRQDHLRQGRSGDWLLLWQMAMELFPEGVQWPYKLRRDWFETGSLPDWLDPNRRRSWVQLGGGGQIEGGIMARISPDSAGWQLIVLVPPERRGRLEIPLISQAVHSLRSAGLPFALSYPPGFIDEELSSLGFRAGRTLTWMGLNL